MFREKLNELISWKQNHNRKPLIVNGARQVGKSWLIKSFGESHFSHFVALNLERNKELHAIFQKDFSIDRILFELELALNQTFRLNETLLFIDEIQSCPEALGSLRYFYEDKPELHVIAAGSLLDFEFRNQPFPVGRVQMMNLFPMTFYEFLIATKKEKLAQLLKVDPFELPKDIGHFFEQDFQRYLIVGGMPECVNLFCTSQDMKAIEKIQDDLLYGYEQDFKKYNPKVNSDCLSEILDSATKNIGNQIIYSKLSTQYSNPTIKKGVEVLKTARIFSKIQNVSANGLPLTPAGKQFKLFYLDVGLMIRRAKFDYQEAFIKNELTTAFRGVLAEQFIAQQLVTQYNDSVNYWARTESGASSEVDFMVEDKAQIIPIEVKSGGKGSLKSMHYLFQNFPHIKAGIVFAKAETGRIDKLYFVPIYWAGQYQISTN